MFISEMYKIVYIWHWDNKNINEKNTCYENCTVHMWNIDSYEDVTIIYVKKVH